MWSWLVSDLLCSVVITMSRMDSIWLTQLTPTDITQDFTTWTHYVYWISQIIKCTREDQLYGSNGIAKNRMHCQSRDTLFKCITNFSHNPLEWASGRVYNLLHRTRGFEKLFLFFVWLYVCSFFLDSALWSRASAHGRGKILCSSCSMPFFAYVIVFVVEGLRWSLLVSR